MSPERGSLQSPARCIGQAVCGIAVLAFIAPLGSAATFAVDDSASVVSTPVSQLRWRATGTGAQREPAADASTQVRLVLNTQPWAGHRARIYMVLAPQPVRVAVRWATRGVLLPGSLQSGGRALVFDGTVPAVLQDQLDVTVTADGRELGTPQRLKFTYEIEPN